MVSLKRIKNKEDLYHILSFLIEDISTYKFIKNYDEVVNSLSNIKQGLED